MCKFIITHRGTEKRRKTFFFTSLFLPMGRYSAINNSIYYLIYLLSCNYNSLAQEKIYKWTDKQGKVHFSNSQTMLEQKEAELPVIQKENIESKIKILKQNTPASCENHGGLDCASGKDLNDGSAICVDGFRDSIQPYDFYCTEAKLSENTKVSEKEEIATIEVSLRNESAIKARNVKVRYKLEDFRKIEVELTGPTDIEPFGLETYTYISKEKLDKRYPDRAIIGKAIISCDNCAPIKRLTKRSIKLTN